PAALTVDSESLPAGSAASIPAESMSVHTLVGNGRPRSQGQVRVVNPETASEMPAGQVGEIWVAGDHVSPGYWNKPDINAQTFQAKLNGAGQNFLRTGDLGFILDDELYVTGRTKDLIIIRGKNYYPQDIELAVESAYPALQKHG